MEVRRHNGYMSRNAQGAIHVDKGHMISKGSEVHACSVVYVYRPQGL